MTLLPILEFPDPRLRTVAEPVEQVDDAIRQLVEQMFATMYEARGIGLAATQVDIHQRLLVMDISEEHDEPLVFINPEIVARDGIQECEEGCLSVPGQYARVERAAAVRVRALNERGEHFEMDLDGLAAICLQHEMDHLEGKLFVDYLSPLKRERLLKKLQKQRLDAEQE